MLQSFSLMAKNSKAYDGDWQGDGWGICWVDKQGRFQVKKSVQPIWKDYNLFEKIPESTFFAIHARSASFPQHKNNIIFNQPYSNKDFIFVFNGLLNGVNIPEKVPGIIGAEKIWFLLKILLKKMEPQKALNKLKDYLIKYTRDIQALNIGLADRKNVYTICFYNRFPKYYCLHYLKNKEISAISSETLPFGFWKKLKSSQILKL